MQLGISTWVWTSPTTDDVIERLVPHIAALGYDVIELPLESTYPFDLEKAKALADAHGLAISVCAVIGPGRDLLLADEQAAGVAYLRASIEAAEALGSPVIAGPFYSAVGRCWRQTPDERERDLNALAETLRTLGSYAADKGVSLAVEPLNRFETSFLNTTAQALDLIARVNHPAVGVGLDLFHLGIEEKQPGDAIRSAGPHLKHVQVAENDRGTPGTGHLPWGDIGQALRDVEYKGRVVIETFSDRVETIARAAAIWRPLAPDSNTLARDGLQFLRDLFAEKPAP